MEQFRKRRDAIVGRLRPHPGVRCHLPDGAFYAFPDVRGLPLSSAALADRLLEEEAVAAARPAWASGREELAICASVRFLPGEPRRGRGPLRPAWSRGS